LAMLARACAIRRRGRAAAQLCLDLGATGGRLRLPDRYELALVIIIILGYGTIVSALRTLKTPEVLVRAAPLLLFAAGLLAKGRVIGVIARCVNSSRRHAGRSKAQTARTIHGGV
jgi:hypothetical protein